MANEPKVEEVRTGSETGYPPKEDYTRPANPGVRAFTGMNFSGKELPAEDTEGLSFEEKPNVFANQAERAKAYVPNAPVVKDPTDPVDPEPEPEPEPEPPAAPVIVSAVGANGTNIVTVQGTAVANATVNITWATGQVTHETADGSGDWIAESPVAQEPGTISVTQTTADGTSVAATSTWTEAPPA